jgi:adenine-specific DNA-methyltransferase
VDYFREQGQIMIATEAGAEGINLQFCSLVVNYDLPWNPQRIEQRIGRCHRYGQKFDVVVVNFLNQKNEADQRVFQLLAEKFSLFEGVFGASDEVLGAIESGVDFEKRIADIYQRCRTKDEIDVSFDQLQQELSDQIDEAMTRTRRQLLENFDAEVQEKLRVSYDHTQEYLNLYERMLMDLTRYELNGHAVFQNGESSFVLHSSPFRGADIPLGRYLLPRRSGDGHLYRLGHLLATRIVARAKERQLAPVEIVFDWSGAQPKVAALEPYLSKAGKLLLLQLRVEALDQAEERLIFAALTDDGEALDPDAARRLFSLSALSVRPAADGGGDARLQEIAAQQQAQAQSAITHRNMKFLEAESAKLDGWADDMKGGLERDIKELDRQIKEARRAATLALTLEEKLGGQKQVKALEVQRNSKRRALFDAQDEIDRRREKLIEDIEAKLQQAVQVEPLLAIRWLLR